jgi:N-acetyl-1-D-myo-inositol-2-amino-2-deoxy-alpha-D-glucopyranoside deacetylase
MALLLPARSRTGGIVAIVAHPDDEALIAGGTLALAARAGIPTGVLALTRGELGPIGDPRLATPATLGDVRERELAEAAAHLGAGWARCLHHPDGELPWVDVETAAGEVAALLAPLAPAALLTFAPDGLYWHPDHIVAREIALRAAALAGPGGPCVYEACWEPETAGALVAATAARGLPASLWGLEPEAFGSPTDGLALTRVDVREVIDRKLRALRAHRTQIDRGHLFATLSDDLGATYLGVEQWHACGGPGPDVLGALLGEAVRV